MMEQKCYTFRRSHVLGTFLIAGTKYPMPKIKDRKVWLVCSLQRFQCIVGWLLSCVGWHGRGCVTEEKQFMVGGGSSCSLPSVPLHPPIQALSLLTSPTHTIIHALNPNIAPLIHIHHPDPATFETPHL